MLYRVIHNKGGIRMSPTAIWLLLCALCLVIEILTVGFLLFFPGVGAFITFLSSLFIDSIAIQIGIFVISSTLLIIFIRPIFTKFLKTKDLPTNSDSLIGKTGIVLKEIVGPDNVGQIKIQGEVWSAICEDKVTLKANSIVTVTSIDGVKLVVKEYTE